MRLEDLYTDILNMTDEESYAFIASYTSQRSSDLTQPIPAPTKEKKTRAKKKTSKDNITVSQEQLALLKQLNLI